MLDYVENWLLRHQVEADQIAGVLIEPVAGEAGILAPSRAFWDGLTALCEKYGWMMILDEVQTGLGPLRARSPRSCGTSTPTSCSWARASPAAGSRWLPCWAASG